MDLGKKDREVIMFWKFKYFSIISMLLFCIFSCGTKQEIKKDTEQLTKQDTKQELTVEPVLLIDMLDPSILKEIGKYREDVILPMCPNVPEEIIRLIEELGGEEEYKKWLLEEARRLEEALQKREEELKRRRG